MPMDQCRRVGGNERGSEMMLLPRQLVIGAWAWESRRGWSWSLALIWTPPAYCCQRAYLRWCSWGPWLGAVWWDRWPTGVKEWMGVRLFGWELSGEKNKWRDTTDAASAG